MREMLRTIATIRLCILIPLLLALLASCVPDYPSTPNPDPAPLTTEVLQVQTTFGRTRVTLSYKFQRQTVVICVHGAGYSSRYFDASSAEITPGYSMLASLTNAGYAIAAPDMPGVSASDTRWPGDLINLTASAQIVHEIAQSLRSRFPRIVFLGHSAGAATVLRAAADYKDPLMVIAQGFAVTPYDPRIPNSAIEALLTQGEYIEYPSEMRRAYLLTAGADKMIQAADKLASDRVPRALFSDMLTLFRSPGLAGADRVTAPIYAQQSTGDVLYPPSLWPASSQVSTYQMIGHSFEFDYTPHAEPVRRDVVSALNRILGGP